MPFSHRRAPQMFSIFRCLTFSALFLSSAFVARADTITDSINVNAQWTDAGGANYFLNLLYSLTFDPLHTVGPTSAGLRTVIAVTNDTPYFQAFDVPTEFFYDASAARLEIAGSANNGFTFDGSDFGIPLTDSYRLQIYLDPSSPDSVNYLDAHATQDNFIFDTVTATIAQTGGTPGQNPIPEPSTLLLVSTGFASLAGMMWRRA